MVTQVTLWKSEKGVLHDCLEDAEREDLIDSIVEALYDGGGYAGDFDIEGAAKELLKHFKVESLEQSK